MGMNHQELVGVAASLATSIGASVQGVWQPSRDRVVVGLSDGRSWLFVPRGPFARVHSLLRRPRNPERPFSFQGACRAHLKGRLTAIEVAPEEREARFVFGEHALILRLTGRSGGLWLVHGEEVMAAFDGPAPERLPDLPPRPAHDAPPRFTAEGDTPFDVAAAIWFSRAESERRLLDRRAQVERDLKRSIERQRRLLANLEADLDKADQAPLLRKKAELLSASVHSVPRGARSAAVMDWDTGETVVLALDPAQTATAQMNTWFAKAKRLERVGERVIERMDTCRSELERLTDVLATVPDADHDALDALAPLLPRPTAPRERVTHVDVTRWTSPTGQRVLVGRNAKGNRRLTFQVARGHDWWMHLRERPGAHVVIPCAREASPDLDLLLAAAQIVLITAKVPAGQSADVQYTRVRDVRSIPGEVARVRLANEKVLHVTREPGALVGWETEGLS